MNIARAIWFNPTIREGVLFVAAAVAVTLAMGFADLANILNTSDRPLDAISTWASAIWVTIFATALKQLSVWGLTKLGKVVQVSRTLTPPPEQTPSPAEVADQAREARKP